MTKALHTTLWLVAIFGMGIVGAKLPDEFWPAFMFCFAVMLWGEP